MKPFFSYVLSFFPISKPDFDPFNIFTANVQAMRVTRWTVLPLAKSPLQISLFRRNCKKWENNPPDISDDLLSCPETILNAVNIVQNQKCKEILTFSPSKGSLLYNFKAKSEPGWYLRVVFARLKSLRPAQNNGHFDDSRLLRWQIGMNITAFCASFNTALFD